MRAVTIKWKLLVILLILGGILSVGCSVKSTSSIPSDFLFIMDVKSAGNFEGCAVNVNIRIEANGKGRYDYYDTGCAIKYDTNHMVTYQPSHIIKTGRIQLSATELEQLWDVINKNNFFSLTKDYRMSMGFAYAFIMVEADGRQHIVDNIGTEIPEMKTIVEATDAILPEEIALDYGERFMP